MTSKAVSTTKAPEDTRPKSGLRVVVLSVVLIVPLLLSGIWPILLFSHFGPSHRLQANHPSFGVSFSVRMPTDAAAQENMPR